MGWLKVFKGIRNGSHVIRGSDKHYYHVSQIMKGGRISMKCIFYFSGKCYGRCSISKKGKNFLQTQRHNHQRDKCVGILRKFRAALLNRCRNGDVTPFKQIYHEERRHLRVPRGVAALLPLSSVRTAMRNARHENFPNNPVTLARLGKLLASDQWNHISSTIDGQDNLYAASGGNSRQGTKFVIFMSNRMKRYLGRVKKVFSDGTFCTPSHLKCNQVWNIVTQRRGHVICLARVLMQTRTAPCYVKVLKKLKRLQPRFKPTSVMSDFEPAQMLGWKSVYPRAARSGCFFHSNKKIGLKASKLRLVPIMRHDRTLMSLVRSLASLPLLPSHLLDDGLMSVADRAHRTGNWRRLKPLLRYMLRTWLSRSRREVFSVYKCPDRTSNVCESDNATLQRSWREKHPSVWNFIHGVSAREDETFQDIKVLERGGKPNRLRKASALANDARLLALWQDLDEETITVNRFLRLASRVMENAFNEAIHMNP